MKNFLNLTIAIISTFFFVTSMNAQINVLSDNSVGIGTQSTSSAEMKIFTDNEYYSLYTENRKPTLNQYGIRAYVASTSTGRAYGLLSYVYQRTGSTNITRGSSNYAYGRGSGATYGLYNYASGTAATGSLFGSYNYVYGNSTSTGTKYGVYARVSSSAAGAKYAGFFDGNIFVSGAVLLWVPTPDTNQKQIAVTNALDKLSMVNTLTSSATVNGKQKTTYTLDANSMRKAFPELVLDVDRTNETIPEEILEKDLEAGGDVEEVNAKLGVETAVDLNSLIPVMVEAIKEQQKEIESLKAQIKAQ